MKFTNITDNLMETLVTKISASELTFMTEDANRVLVQNILTSKYYNNKSNVEILVKK